MADHVADNFILRVKHQLLNWIGKLYLFVYQPVSKVVHRVLQVANCVVAQKYSDPRLDRIGFETADLDKFVDLFAEIDVFL